MPDEEAPGGAEDVSGWSNQQLGTHLNSLHSITVKGEDQPGWRARAERLHAADHQLFLEHSDA